MSNILVLNSSAAGEASVSRLLVADAVAELTERLPGAQVVFRDLAADPIPHLLPSTINGVRGQPTSPAELEARALSDKLIAELRTADVIVIGAPMYNFSVPTTLRTWFDHVLRAGETFSYSEAGPKGLLTGKRVIIAMASAGTEAGSAIDFATPYLRFVLGFMGITDVDLIHADRLIFGAEETIKAAFAQVDALAA